MAGSWFLRWSESPYSLHPRGRENPPVPEKSSRRTLSESRTSRRGSLERGRRADAERWEAAGWTRLPRPREWMNEHTRPTQRTPPPPPWGHRPHCSSSHTKIETELKAPAALRSDLIFCHTEHSLTGRDSRRRFSKRKGVNNCLSEWAPTTG